MEGETKHSIPLDAPLDINSNDMLVSASSPKWSFNRQRYLGSVLQNSVRYERDGWFAGWWTHNFEAVSLGTIIITPDDMGPVMVVKDGVSWDVRFPDERLQFEFTGNPWERWIISAKPVTPSPGVVRLSDAEVQITGHTAQGTWFSTTVDAYTGAVISHQCPDPALQSPLCTFEGNEFHYLLKEVKAPDSDMVWVRFGSNLMFGGTSINYAFDGTTHKWEGFFELNDNTMTMTSLKTANSEYVITTQRVVNFALLDEYVECDIDALGLFTVKLDTTGMFDNVAYNGRVQGCFSETAGYFPDSYPGPWDRLDGVTGNLRNPNTDYANGDFFIEVAVWWAVFIGIDAYCKMHIEESWFGSYWDSDGWIDYYCFTAGSQLGHQNERNGIVLNNVDLDPSYQTVRISSGGQTVNPLTQPDSAWNMQGLGGNSANQRYWVQATSKRPGLIADHQKVVRKKVFWSVGQSPTRADIIQGYVFDRAIGTYTSNAITDALFSVSGVYEDGRTWTPGSAIDATEPVNTITVTVRYVTAVVDTFTMWITNPYAPADVTAVPKKVFWVDRLDAPDIADILQGYILNPQTGTYLASNLGITVDAKYSDGASWTPGTPIEIAGYSRTNEISVDVQFGPTTLTSFTMYVKVPDAPDYAEYVILNSFYADGDFPDTADLIEGYVRDVTTGMVAVDMTNFSLNCSYSDSTRWTPGDPIDVNDPNNPRTGEIVCDVEYNGGSIGTFSIYVTDATTPATPTGIARFVEKRVYFNDGDAPDLGDILWCYNFDDTTGQDVADYTDWSISGVYADGTAWDPLDPIDVSTQTTNAITITVTYAGTDMGTFSIYVPQPLPTVTDNRYTLKQIYFNNNNTPALGDIIRGWTLDATGMYVEDLTGWGMSGAYRGTPAGSWAPGSALNVNTGERTGVLDCELTFGGQLVASPKLYVRDARRPAGLPANGDGCSYAVAYKRYYREYPVDAPTAANFEVYALNYNTGVYATYAHTITAPSMDANTRNRLFDVTINWNYINTARTATLQCYCNEYQMLSTKPASYKDPLSASQLAVANIKATCSAKLTLSTLANPLDFGNGYMELVCTQTDASVSTLSPGAYATVYASRQHGSRTQDITSDAFEFHSPLSYTRKQVSGHDLAIWDPTNGTVYWNHGPTNPDAAWIRETSNADRFKRVALGDTYNGSNDQYAAEVDTKRSFNWIMRPDTPYAQFQIPFCTLAGIGARFSIIPEQPPNPGPWTPGTISDSRNGQVAASSFTLEEIGYTVGQKSYVALGTNGPYNNGLGAVSLAVGAITAVSGESAVAPPPGGVKNFQASILLRSSGMRFSYCDPKVEWYVDDVHCPGWIISGNRDSLFKQLSSFPDNACPKVLFYLRYYFHLKSVTTTSSYSPNNPTQREVDQRLIRSSFLPATDFVKFLGTNNPLSGNGLEHSVLYIDQQQTTWLDVWWDAISNAPKYTYNNNDVHDGEFKKHSGTNWTVQYSQDSGKLTFKTGDVTVQRTEHLTQQFKRAFIYRKTGAATPITIRAADSQSVTFNQGYGKVDAKGNYTADVPPSVYLDMVELLHPEDIKVHVLPLNVNSAEVRYIPHGIWKRNNGNLHWVSTTGNTVVFEWNGVEHTLVIGNDVENKFAFYTTDIRNEEMKQIYQADFEDLRMAVKQFWSGDATVECFWWIDDEHVLALTKADLILYTKEKDATGAYLLHDWMGDRWIVKSKGPRSNFLGNNDIYYSVSCAKAEEPVFFTLSYEGNSLVIKYLTDLTNVDWANMRPWATANAHSVTVPVNEVQYGDTNAPDSKDIHGYQQLDIKGLITTGAISHTCVSGKFMIGLHATNGLKQWTIVIDKAAASVDYVITGYGCVGLDGLVTGGQLPAQACDTTGLNKHPKSIAEFVDLDLARPETLGFACPDGECYGVGDMVYFVYRECKDIVSHFDFVGGTHVPVTIPLRSHYTSTTFLEGHKQCAIQDFQPQTMGLIGLLTTMSGKPDPAIEQIGQLVDGAFLPSVWFVNSQLVWGYSSQVLMEQGALVWRNSLPKAAEDGKGDLDKIVKRRWYRCELALNVLGYGAMVLLTLSALESLSAVTEDLAMNAGQNMNAVSDAAGRKLAAHSLEVLSNVIDSKLDGDGTSGGSKVEMYESIALSMFYSVGDGAQCWAGPGFVNHQFICQVVAQGQNYQRCKIEQVSNYVPLKLLTQIANQAQVMIYKATVDGLEGTMETLAAGAAGSSPAGAAIAAGMAAVTVALVAAKGLLGLAEFMRDKGIDAFYDMIGAEQRTAREGKVSLNNLNVEHTHVYGDKPISLFYPTWGTETPATMTHDNIEAKNYVTMGLDIPIGSRAKVSQSFETEFNADWNNANESEGLFKPEGFHFAFSQRLRSPSCELYNLPSLVQMPANMTLVEGVTTMFEEGRFRNEQINRRDYTFPAPPFQDFVISRFGESDKCDGVTASCTMGMVGWYSFDDTKIMDGQALNMVELPSKSFFGIASSYVAIELKKSFDMDYLRPWAITPTTIALNINKTNSVHDAKAYHSFDGQMNRITSWKGGSGLDKCTLVSQYLFVSNDHFKRSNVNPPSKFLGYFGGPPQVRMRTMNTDKLINQVADPTRGEGITINTPGEDRDARRYSLPVLCDLMSTLPATVRVLAPYKLHVVDGITALTTDLRNNQYKYKPPESVDFNLYDLSFRATEEYVCQVQLKSGMQIAIDQTPSAGLTYVGATSREAFFYSPATRMYYSFSGGGDMSKKDVLNRFQELREGRWDFVSQEVVFKCLLKDGYSNAILQDDVHGNIVARMDGGGINGELTPPNETIYNERSDFKIFSMAGGLVYQGPKRHSVHRFIITDDMHEQIKNNKRRWLKLHREEWAPARDYGWRYEDVRTTAPMQAVVGWTHNPWRAATAMLGESEETDCKFEWEINFCWTDTISKLFEQNEFVSFNCAGETIGQGGTLLSRPTHIYLYRELFKNGYYSMRYQSGNGAGNRERLYLWGDGLSAVEDLTLYTKEITPRRTQPLATSQVDVQELTEQ